MTAHIHVKIWIERDGKELFGAGRAALLQEVAARGSLKKAAESMGMSYRAAWGRIKRIEQALGFAVLVAAGGRREGFQLTDQGRALAEAFIRWQEDVSDYARSKAKGLPLGHV